MLREATCRARNINHLRSFDFRAESTALSHQRSGPRSRKCIRTLMRRLVWSCSRVEVSQDGFSMGTRHLIMLPRDLVDRCRQFGEAAVGSFQRGESENSRAVSMLDIENDPEAQAHAKMGECAFCLWSGIPIEELSWRAKADLGWDAVKCGIRFDIKTAIKIFYRLLIWPANKTKLYDKKNLNILVMVRGDVPQFEIVGWTDKETFGQDHSTGVPSEEDWLVPVTWCVSGQHLAD